VSWKIWHQHAAPGRKQWRDCLPSEVRVVEPVQEDERYFVRLLANLDPVNSNAFEVDEMMLGIIGHGGASPCNGLTEFRCSFNVATVMPIGSRCTSAAVQATRFFGLPRNWPSDEAE
jgi:hypothetical protein